MWRMSLLLACVVLVGCQAQIPCPDDGFACTDEMSVEGVCISVPDDAGCDDGNGCTDDLCDPDDPRADANGCVHAAVTDDGFACTDEMSVEGVCISVPDDAGCDDGNGCTDDLCDPDDPRADANGCVHAAVTEVTDAMREACSDPPVSEVELELLACTFEILRREGITEADAQTAAEENCADLPPDGIFEQDAEACEACLPVVVEQVYAGS